MFAILASLARRVAHVTLGPEFFATMNHRLHEVPMAFKDALQDQTASYAAFVALLAKDANVEQLCGGGPA